jgi:hypothetical protein
MKRHIVNIFKILIFIIIFIYFYYFLTIFKKPINYQLDNISGIYAERKNSLDMVYIGGSAAFVYYSPIDAYKNYGISSYDYAVDTIQAELYPTMIKELLKTQKPKVVVIDARAFQYREKDLKPNEISYRVFLRGFKYNLDRYKLINKIVPKYLKQGTLTYHLDLGLYHTEESPPSFIKTFNIMFDKNKNLDKGFYLVPKAMNIYKYDRDTKEELKIASESEKLLNELLDYLEKRNVKALFVVSPYQQIKREKMQFNYIAKIVKSRNQDFLDANDYIDQIKLDFTYDFYNGSHVNIYGAEKYTKFLSEYLIKKYNLPDRRGDKLYDEDFNNLIPKWNQNVEETKKTIKEIIARKGYEEEIQTK